MTQQHPPPYRPGPPAQPGPQPYAQPAYGESPYGRSPYGQPAPGYPSPYGSAGYYGPPPVVPQPTNGLATGGFVVALVGAVLALVPFVGIVAWVISPVGLVLSIVAQAAAIRRGGVGRGLANAGIVLGAVGLLICVLWVSAFASATSTPSTSGTGSTAPTYSSAPSSASAPAPAVPAGSFGQGTYTVGGEIAPGRYRTAGAPADSLFPFCAAYRKQADGTPIGIPETTNEGPAYITVRASDGLVEFSGDCVWSPAS
ncbi:DUF4190 domain-containing protein [Actinomycetospora lemnae]|uniref:DUF4190 domain-containing protein n=1 Tax=Actinomycetospora lemnae TaxID=3019891 RepID=A0ABT5SQ53_9PSEU|nr:DUF4190 domain-containing protein [Actinomycetospora sp. DW7H6]MDD7963918.1 DUF4190 domain-containing protein [Actinomycetospora sp. DW7H6]